MSFEQYDKKTQERILREMGTERKEGARYVVTFYDGDSRGRPYGSTKAYFRKRDDAIKRLHSNKHATFGGDITNIKTGKKLKVKYRYPRKPSKKAKSAYVSAWSWLTGK